MKFVVAVSFIYLTVGVGSGTSLQCYECNSQVSSQRKICMDPFFGNSSLLRNCSSLDIGCVKYDTIVSDVKYATKRGCVTYNDLRYFQKEQIKSDSLEYCETDGCNNSQSLESSVVVMIFTAAVLKCLVYGLR